MSCVRVAVSIALTLMATTLTATARPQVIQPADEVARDASTPAQQPGPAGGESQDEGKPQSSAIIIAHCDVWDGGATRGHAATGGVLPTLATLDRTPFAEVAPAPQHLHASSEPEPMGGARRCRVICRHPNAPPLC